MYGGSPIKNVIIIILLKNILANSYDITSVKKKILLKCIWAVFKIFSNNWHSLNSTFLTISKFHDFFLLFILYLS